MVPGTALRHEVVPFTRQSAGNQAPARVETSSGPWIDKAAARSRDARWYELNLPRLTTYAGLWVAIRDQRIVASAASFQGVYDQLSAVHIDRAFIVQVPKNVRERTYLIA